MMTVRFPNGQAVQYNDANYVIRSETVQQLYTRKDGQWIANVPIDCIVEGYSPCRVYNALAEHQDRRLEAIEKELRSIKRRLPKARP